MNVMLQRYNNIRKLTVDLCRPLETEDYVVQPADDVSPPKWHLGHTTWFFEQFILLKHNPAYKKYNTHFNFLFNSYYNSMGQKVVKSNRGNLSRPTVKEILKFRDYVDKGIADLFESSAITKALMHLIELGINHEQQHQELLLMDIKYIFATNPFQPVYSSKKIIPPPAINNNNYSSINSGLYEAGNNGHVFCYDNEKPRHKIYLHDTKITDRLVTNAEFLSFINNGGYQQPEYWLSDGWAWLQKHQIKCPLYWFIDNEQWYYFTLHGKRKLDSNAPVSHVSYYEADAYARWKGMRLPTEYEWEVYAQQNQANTKGGFLNTHTLIPLEANKNKYFTGVLWEWTQSTYAAYPGYVQPRGAVGEYNGKFMVNQYVLKGGSFATPESHFRNTYRNFYYPGKRWQFAGFRLAHI